MPRTHKITQEEAGRTVRLLHAHERLVWLTYNGRKPDAVETFKEDGDTYRYELWGATASYGGLLVEVFSSPSNRHKHVDVRYFDDARPSEYAVLRYRVAYERLSIARNKALRGED